MGPVVRRIATALIALALAAPAWPGPSGSPDVLVLGDSQLSFGAGVAFVDLLRGMAGDCGLPRAAQVGVIGVRSSTLVAWTGRSRSAKGAICDVDPKWGVNAGAYGTLSPGANPFVQIGRGARFQFCAEDRSPLAQVFDSGYYMPRLLIMFLMGNSTDRWADSPAAAMSDARAFVADLPPGLPCVFMTSAPPYGEKVVRRRQRAQDNIARAFASVGRQCSFVPGFTPDTIRENLANARNFRRTGTGKVKDPFHPTEAAARRFLALRRAELCKAISVQLAAR